MPSGITSDIYEGKDVSLRGYLMRVGRSMGFSIMQRDDDYDAPIKHVEPRTEYHDERLAEATETLTRMAEMSDEDATAAARDAFDEAYRAWMQRQGKDDQLRARYEAMIEAVEGWRPDPLMESTKQSALKYLRESIQFDCPENRTYDREPQLLSGPEWRQEQIDKANRDVEYHTAEHIKEVARADERNRYIDAFYASLPPAKEEAAHA